jgi:ABC-2 type transport system permease protein
MNALKFFRLLAALNARMASRRVGAVRQQSRLMIAVIALFVATYWFTGYFAFKWGFVNLTRYPWLGGMLMDRMLYLFFAFLFLMLVFSNTIIGYASLFKSQETQWMLTLPVRHVDVFCWKLVETMLLSSWAFLFLSAPLMLAYGSVRDVGGWFYVKVAALYLPFIVIPSAVGALTILLVTRYLHRRMFKWALFGLSALGIACAVVCLKPMEVGQLRDGQTAAMLNQLLDNSRVTLQPMLPSYWVASSMIAWGNGWAWKGTFFFLVLLSNAMMAMLVCVTASGRLFYNGWSRNHSQGNLFLGMPLLDREINLPRMGLLEKFLRALPGMHPASRALMLKDMRAFWRDTSQWSQFVIFFGLLGLYVLNLRNVGYETNHVFWSNFVAILNLGASSMTLATLTTRFVFPQFSLEGKRLWMVGMAPDGLRRLLLEKLWLSSACSVSITLSLTLFSCWMLRLPPWQTLLFGATVVLMSFTLCGIAVGVGALFPNFSTGSTANRPDDNPAKIVSGFGGTLCFLLSLMYIGLVISAEAAGTYFQFGPQLGGEFGDSWALLGSWLFVSVLSLIAGCVPMALALKRVDSLEM